MAEFGVSEWIALGEAVGIIGTLFVIFYFSRRGVQKLSVDIETRVLNDLNEKLHRAGEMLVQKPEMVTVLVKNPTTQSEDVVFAYYVLYMCAHAFHMRRRGVLSDNEWAGWLRWMKSAFELGTIGEYWKENIQPERWFDPAFQDFINNEIIKTRP